MKCALTLSWSQRQQEVAYSGRRWGNSKTSLMEVELVKSITRGKEIYTDFCMQCHLGNGKGSETVPPLANSDWLVNKRNESIHSVKYGQSGPIKVNGKNYNAVMSPMGLTNEEVADVMNYIMNSWGNKQTKMVTVTEVKAVKK